MFLEMQRWQQLSNYPIRNRGCSPTSKTTKCEELAAKHGYGPQPCKNVELPLPTYRPSYISPWIHAPHRRKHSLTRHRTIGSISSHHTSCQCHCQSPSEALVIAMIAIKNPCNTPCVLHALHITAIHCNSLHFTAIHCIQIHSQHVKTFTGQGVHLLLHYSCIDSYLDA